MGLGVDRVNWLCFCFKSFVPFFFFNNNRENFVDYIALAAVLYFHSLLLEFSVAAQREEPELIRHGV